MPGTNQYMTTATDTPQTPAGKQVRILVAEDSPLNQQGALKQLEKLGYEADAVSDGSQVIEALTRARYDIILMDCQMPNMSGYEAAWQIRNREKEHANDAVTGKHVYIIAMTANTEADNREKCASAGMDGFINKPVQLAELEAALLRAFADRVGGEEIIDPVIIAGLRQLRTPGKADPLVELIDLFLREAPAQLDAMTEAVSKNDATSLSRTISTATALKGSAGNLGARNLAALCDEIEQIAKSWTLADAQPLIERARQEFDRARAELERIKTG